MKKVAATLCCCCCSLRWHEWPPTPGSSSSGWQNPPSLPLAPSRPEDRARISKAEGGLRPSNPRFVSLSPNRKVAPTELSLSCRHECLSDRDRACVCICYQPGGRSKLELERPRLGNQQNTTARPARVNIRVSPSPHRHSEMTVRSSRAGRANTTKKHRRTVKPFRLCFLLPPTNKPSRSSYYVVSTIAYRYQQIIFRVLVWYWYK